MTAPSITRMSRTEYDALTTAIRHGGRVMRTRDHKITTLIALERRGWATLIRITKRGRTQVAAAEITTAGRNAVQRFADQHGRGVDPKPFPTRTASVDPFVLMGATGQPDLLDQLIPA